MPLETMDPHFEGSQPSGRALTPMEDSDEESGALRQYQTRMPNIDDGIILARSFDEKDEG